MAKSFEPQMEELMKGGPGSGKLGHVTQRENGDHIVNLNNKLLTMNPFRSQLEKIKAGGTWEGKETQSGKPVFNDVTAGIAHGYMPADFKDVGNMHYDAMQMIDKHMEQLKHLDKKIPDDMKALRVEHERQFKQNFSYADKLANRMKNTESSIQKRKETEKKVAKSLVGMGYIDAPEVDTSKFATEQKLSLEHELHHRIQSTMEGYSFGDEPRSIGLDKGMLHLTKVDDGLYSGYVTLSQQLNNPDANRMETMEDNAKVRLERMTIPTLVNFLLAKEYVMPEPLVQPEVMMDPEKLQELNAIMADQAPMIEAPIVNTALQDKIRMLELIDRLVN